MNDREDEVQSSTGTTLLPVKTVEMKRFASQLILLEDFCKRLAADRESWALTGDEFSDKIEEVKKLVEESKTIPSEMKKAVLETSKILIQSVREDNARTAHTISEGVHQMLKETISSHVDGNIRKLDNAFVNTSNRLDGIESRWESMMKWFALAGFGAIILGGLVAGGLVSYRFPAQTFTEEQSRLMKNGRILDSAWKNLSKQEKDRFNEAASK